MTPKQFGYRMPAEWELHQATWLSWPHKESSWPGKLDRILPVFAQMIAALARSETVHINVNDAAMERAAQRLLRQVGAQGDIRFHNVPTNDAWCRDYGALFVRRDSAEAGFGMTARSWQADGREHDKNGLAAIDWDFNSWGNKYPPFDLDNRMPQRMAELIRVPRFEAAMILEGGSIDVNGHGLLLTTESCLLNPNRNPQLSREQIEQRLCDYLGVDRVLWLEGGILGDDTDGHVDDLARFVAPNVIVTAAEADPSDGNFRVLQDNLSRLQSLRNLDGRPFDVVTLPMPPPVASQGERLPATYLNFYIANRVVLLPGFHPKSDEIARRVLKELFPEREIVQIDCTDLIWGLGAFHCLTQQVPAAEER